MAGDPPSFEDLAVRQGLLSAAQVEECRRLRDKVAAEGLPVELEEIFVKKGYLTKAQAAGLRASLGKGVKTAVEGYEVLSKLGQGGMGAVYKAKQTSLDRVVAIKILLPEFAKDKDGVERFLREAKALARLNHPNIVAGIDAGASNGVYYYVMEYLDGETLAQRLARRKCLPPAEAADLVRQMAAALEHARQHGLIHRDVKPANILLLKDGTAKLADLGMARFAAHGNLDLTRSGQIMGTPLYMSPEQARGDDLDIRTDLYALGVTLFEMLSGKPPFTGDTPLVVLHKQIHEPIPWEALKGAPADLLHVGRKLTEKDRGRRYATPAEAVHDLEAVKEGRPVAAPPPAALRVKPHKTTRIPVVARRRSPTPLALGAVGAVALVGVLAFMLRPDAPPPAPPPSRPGPRAAVDPSPATPRDQEALKAFRAVRDFEKTHPDDAEEIASLYAALRSKTQGTAYEEPVAAAYELARKHLDGVVTAAAAKLGSEVNGLIRQDRIAEAGALIEGKATAYKTPAWAEAIQRERRRLEKARAALAARPEPSPTAGPATEVAPPPKKGGATPERNREPEPAKPAVPTAELRAVEVYLDRAEKLAASRDYARLLAEAPKPESPEARAVLDPHLEAYREAGDLLKTARDHLLAQSGKAVSFETRSAGRAAGRVEATNATVLLVGGKTYDANDLTIASAAALAKSVRGAAKPEAVLTLAVLEGQLAVAEDAVRKGAGRGPDRIEKRLSELRAERDAEALLKAAERAKKEDQVARFSELLDKFPSTRAAEAARKKLEAVAKEIVLWAADLPEAALTGDFRLEEEEDSAGGRILTSECLSEVEALPPQNEHTATFRAPVIPGVPYRLWVRMKTNEVCGATRANLLYVQAPDATERSTRTALTPGGPGWVTLRSDGTEGWAWIGRDHADPKSAGAWIVFKTPEAVLRVYEGNDRVGIDQLVLSPQKYFSNAPTDLHLPKSTK